MRWKPFLKGIVTKLWGAPDALETLFEGNCNEVVNVSRMKKATEVAFLGDAMLD